MAKRPSSLADGKSSFLRQNHDDDDDDDDEDGSNKRHNHNYNNYHHDNNNNHHRPWAALAWHGYRTMVPLFHLHRLFAGYLFGFHLWPWSFCFRFDTPQHGCELRLRGLAGTQCTSAS